MTLTIHPASRFGNGEARAQRHMQYYVVTLLLYNYAMLHIMPHRIAHIISPPRASATVRPARTDIYYVVRLYYV